MKEVIDAKQLHDSLLSMMKDFHSFCLCHGIRYYIIGGTALGAKRHEGFIPWDDDMDVGIPREDYEKLFSLRDELPDYLEIKFQGNDRNCPIPYFKLINKNTTLIESYYENYVEGLYIDLFPLDYAIKNSKKDYARRKRIYSLFMKICWKKTTKKKKGLLRKAYQLYCRCFSDRTLYGKLFSLMTALPESESDSYANFLGAYGEKECILKSYFGVPTLYKFEDAEFYGPSNIEGYLTFLYGDYMILPPPEKRVFKHGFSYLSLSLPYKEYGE